MYALNKKGIKEDSNKKQEIHPEIPGKKKPPTALKKAKIDWKKRGKKGKGGEPKQKRPSRSPQRGKTLKKERMVAVAGRVT